jgi:hypothetical protein
MSVGIVFFYLCFLWNVYCLFTNPYSIVSWLFVGVSVYFIYDAYGARVISWFNRKFR